MLMQSNPLINALLSEATNYTPIWFMRQAGRYLPEYRELRSQAGSFLNLCKNPDLATTITLQPLKRFALDAAILFSDILVIPDAMGLKLSFIENEGPQFANPITTEADIDNLATDGILDRLDYVFSTIKHTKLELNNQTPLIGFSGSPFTLACYMLEGKSSKNYTTIKKWLYTNPKSSHKLLNKLSDVIIEYLNRQIESGCDVVMLFDSWGGVLTESMYNEFSLFYLKKIVAALHKTHLNKPIPNIIFTKGGGLWLPQINEIKASAIGIDWTIDIAKAKAVVGNGIALQGNLDPVILAVGDRSCIKQEVIKILDGYKRVNNGSIIGHVFNVGHGLLPNTKIDNVTYVVDLVHELTSQ